MTIFEWDENKRLKTLRERGLDFRDAEIVLDGRPSNTVKSDRGDEERFASTALTDEGFLTVIWTPRENRVRIISMRKSRDGEKRAYRQLHG
jgi:hypothetical protein